MALERDRFDENRVDGLLYALGRGERPEAVDSSDDALVDMLLDWRASTEAAPFPAGPGEEAIEAALSGGGAGDASQPASLASARARRDKRRGMRRLSTVAVGAASVVAIAVGSVSVMAYNAQPGSPLWNANQTLFGGNSDNGVELVSALEKDLAAANDALQRGDSAEASRLLQSVSDRLDGVESAADRVNLIRLRDQIQRQLDRGESGSRSTAPGAPGGGTTEEKPRLEPGDTSAPSSAPQSSAPAPAPSAIPGHGESSDSSLAQIAPPPAPVNPPPAQPNPSTDPVSPISPDDLSVLRAPSPTTGGGNGGTGGNGGQDNDSQPTSRPKSGADSAQQSPRSGSPDATGSTDGGADLRSADGK